MKNEYGSYKESNVQWLGLMPKHWSLTKIKNRCFLLPSNVDKKSYKDETSVKLCNYVDVYYNDFIDGSVDFMEATANDREIKKFQLRKEDVLITKDSEDPFDIAVPALVTETQKKLICGYHLSILRSNHEQNFNGSYLFWVLKDVAIASQLYREATGITRWAIAIKHVKNSIIPFPPFREQLKISEYLNNKTAEIEKLKKNITKQIETLEQYRKSIIHECVTGKRRITLDDVKEQ